MRIILFGGFFNPIHNGHIQAAFQAMEKINARKVIFFPSYEPFDKKENYEYISMTDRMEMLNQVIKNVPNFELDNFEYLAQKKCYMIDLVKYLRKKYYNNNIYILIGSDQLENIKKWKDYDTLIELASFICYEREGYKINEETLSKHDFVFIHSSNNSISSTNIRNNMYRYDLPYRALKYINEHGLYFVSRVLPFMTTKRFEHSIRVGLMAYELMQKYDNKKAIKGWVAGIYHDICKEFDKDRIEFLAYDKYHVEYTKYWKILHGIVAKYFLKETFNFDDEEILNAIANHTKPNHDKKQLTTLDKVLFLADKLEPNRTEKDVTKIDEIRKLAKANLDQAYDKLLDTLEEMYACKNETETSKETR